MGYSIKLLQLTQATNYNVQNNFILQLTQATNYNVQNNFSVQVLPYGNSLIQ